MQAPLSFSCRGQQLWLSPEKVIFWEAQQALIISDLHLGKTGHFRKSGIAVPQHMYKEDLQRLLQCVQYFQPKQMIVVGDLFHSVANKELDLFLRWRESFSGIEVLLIKGNHDMLHADWYKSAGIETKSQQVFQSPFLFVHDINDEQDNGIEKEHFSISGHIHPGIIMKGLGKQSLRLPCFYFSDTYAVLPAFGAFTGLHIIEHQKSDTVFAIINQTIVQVQ